MSKKPDDQFRDEEAKARIDASLRGWLNTKPKPLKV